MKPKYSINLKTREEKPPRIEKIKKTIGTIVLGCVIAFGVHGATVGFVNGGWDYITSREVQRQQDIMWEINELRHDFNRYKFLSEESKEGFRIEEKKLQDEYNSLENKMAKGKAAWQITRRRTLMPWTYLTD